MSDEKDDRDGRPQFSQLDLDAATKPLHAEIARLHEYDSGWEDCVVCQKPTQNGVWCCDGCLDDLHARHAALCAALAALIDDFDQLATESFDHGRTDALRYCHQQLAAVLATHRKTP
jgi:hypothetical protein